MANTKLNILPVPTFSSLGVNHAERDIKEYETAEYTVSDSDTGEITQYINSDTLTNITVEENVVSKLVQIFAGKGRTVSRLNITLADSARLELIQLYLGGNYVSEIVTELNGKRSFFAADIAYDLGAGGELDVDANSESDNLSSSPVENIYFANPVPGQYWVYVNNYLDRTPDRAGNYLVRITVGGQSETFTGSLANEDDTVEVAGFQYNGSPAQ
jgi:hypothetical protein